MAYSWLRLADWAIQQATLGHRGRKLLLVAAEQLTSRGRARLRAALALGAGR